MSRRFGPATQNGIVVADLDAALAHWTGTLGVGPVFRFDQLRTKPMPSTAARWPRRTSASPSRSGASRRSS